MTAGFWALEENKTVVLFNNYENFTVNQMTANIYYDFEYNGK